MSNRFASYVVIKCPKIGMNQFNKKMVEMHMGL